MAIGINWDEIWKPVWKPVWNQVAPEVEETPVAARVRFVVSGSTATMIASTGSSIRFVVSTGATSQISVGS